MCELATVFSNEINNLKNGVENRRVPLIKLSVSTHKLSSNGLKRPALNSFDVVAVAAVLRVFFIKSVEAAEDGFVSIKIDDATSSSRLFFPNLHSNSFKPLIS